MDETPSPDKTKPKHTGGEPSKEKHNEKYARHVHNFREKNTGKGPINHTICTFPYSGKRKHIQPIKIEEEIPNINKNVCIGYP